MAVAAADEADLIRAAMHIGLKARLVAKVTAKRLMDLPTPAIVRVNGALMVMLLPDLELIIGDGGIEPREHRTPFTDA